MTAMRDVWGEKLVEFGHADPRTVVLDGDLANSTKADKFAKAHPDRFFQMGIAEQNLVGAAAGLASVGFVPWTSSFTVFFTHRALDPIRMLVAQSHANVKIVGSYSGVLVGAVCLDSHLPTVFVVLSALIILEGLVLSYFLWQRETTAYLRDV